MQVIAYRENGDTSNIERVFLYKDSGATAGTEGDPITGLTNASTGLIISTIAHNEATAVTDTSAATSSIETITTLGTYATPTAGFVRFKEVDATNLPGLYEIQWENARYAVASGLWLDVCISGVADLAPFHGRIYTNPIPANAIELGGAAQSLTDLKDFADAGYDPATNKVQGVVLTDTITTYTGNTVQTADHTAGIADIPTVAEFNARTLVAASYFDPAADTVANVTTCANNTDMRGTDGANTTAPDNASIAAILTDTADMQPKIGTPAADLSADVAAVKVDTAATLMDTGNTLPAILGTPAGADMSADIASLQIDTTNLRAVFKKNTAISNIEFLMIDSVDDVTPKTGLTVTGQRSIDGGAFANVSGTIAEVGSGIYQFDALAADTNGGVITYKFASTGANDSFVTIHTTA